MSLSLYIFTLNIHVALTVWGLHVVLVSFHEGQWLCGSVQTFRVRREELLNVFLGFSIRSELCGLPLCAYCGPNLHTLSDSECLLTQFLCFYIGIHLLVQQPGINHRCVNQVTENSKITLSVSHLHVKSHYVTAEQVNISHVAIIHRQISWAWHFHMLLFLSIKLPHLCFGDITNKCRNASNIAVIFKCKIRNITRINICAIFLWKK